MYTYRKDLWDRIFCSKYQFLASSCYELPQWCLRSYVVETYLFWKKIRWCKPGKINYTWCIIWINWRMAERSKVPTQMSVAICNSGSNPARMLWSFLEFLENFQTLRANYSFGQSWAIEGPFYIKVHISDQLWVLVPSTCYRMLRRYLTPKI